jgi:hypothetical protein
VRLAEMAIERERERERERRGEFYRSVNFASAGNSLICATARAETDHERRCFRGADRLVDS